MGKRYLLEQFLNDSQCDVGTGLLISRGFGFCFVLKQPYRWGQNEDGIPILPFEELEENSKKTNYPLHLFIENH